MERVGSLLCIGIQLTITNLVRRAGASGMDDPEEPADPGTEGVCHIESRHD